jgi:hypothetical protein
VLEWQKAPSFSRYEVVAGKVIRFEKQKHSTALIANRITSPVADSPRAAPGGATTTHRLPSASVCQKTRKATPFDRVGQYEADFDLSVLTSPSPAPHGEECLWRADPPRSVFSGRSTPR